MSSMIFARLSSAGVIITVSTKLEMADQFRGMFGYLTNKNYHKCGMKKEESVTDISMSVYFIFSS